MRLTIAILLAGATAIAACTGSSSTSPTSPSVSPTMTGSWVGTASDSTGSFMGAGLSSAMMGGTTWVITQNGPTFSGTMHFPGHMTAGMIVSGTMSGYSGTFTMSMSSGSMMNGMCAATATGTFDMDDLMTQLHAIYSGMNSCSGPFDHGQMTLHR